MRLLLSLSALVFLAGCPYESPKPLSMPAGAIIDEKLLGSWKYAEKGKREAGLVTISRFNDSELLIVLEEEGKMEREMMRGYVTNIDGEKFLNLQNIEGGYDARKWIFVSYTTGDCSLTYRVVNDSIAPAVVDPGLSSDQLRKLIKKNLRNKQIYDEETTLTCTGT